MQAKTDVTKVVLKDKREKLCDESLLDSDLFHDAKYLVSVGNWEALVCLIEPVPNKNLMLCEIYSEALVRTKDPRAKSFIAESISEWKKSTRLKCLMALCDNEYVWFDFTPLSLIACKASYQECLECLSSPDDYLNRDLSMLHCYMASLVMDQLPLAGKHIVEAYGLDWLSGYPIECWRVIRSIKPVKTYIHLESFERFSDTCVEHIGTDTVVVSKS